MFVEKAFVKIYFVYFGMNKQRRNRRNDYYLDVAEFVLTDHRFKVPSPRRSPAQTYLNEVFFNIWLKCLE